MTKLKKKTRKAAKKYYSQIKKNDTVYVWGMNYPTIITEASIKKAYEDNKTARYNKAYYLAKYEEGKGRPGSDCSGEHYGLSEYDTNAAGYYKRCTEKGSFVNMPIKEMLLLFKIDKKTGNIVHTGFYYGNGICVHMKSSAENCVEESVDNHNWTYWGKADFIDYESPMPEMKPVLTRVLKKDCKGVDVKFLQTMLKEENYECGEIDGIFGNKTLIAVKNYQTDLGLTVTGTVGKKTGKKLGFKWEG